MSLIAPRRGVGWRARYRCTLGQSVYGDSHLMMKEYDSDDVTCGNLTGTHTIPIPVLTLSRDMTAIIIA